ncbi:N-acetylneuraminate synthase family protein [Halothermothrix orenii]|uniref:N-acetylneuraminate synthase n=1 Tax=Halothermothrix orenii (strain H 168 / OCM 544 / DSM 9562) TaxID=373903 RepID=B8CYT0_HALOH|nr:N-acetylneuraminate synthase family protein [Halothermothrix orenii]ACL70449.1 N-acetylneuraminate synthase [Halothermothrix orenii H 168]
MKPYIIGETAYNHQGDIHYLKRMIDDIAEIGLQAVKFHLLLNPESYLQNKHPLIKKIKEWIFTEKEWDEIINYSKQKGLDMIALCDDLDSLKFIKKYHRDLKGIEIHASSLNDYFLLEEARDFPNSVILGIGGSTLDEIEYAVNFLKQRGKEDIILMYGFQSYPTDYTQINLAKMQKLKNLFNLPVGYADHTAYDDKYNVDISVMAAAMGINILEKHYTPDYGVKRIDYHAAVGKKQMKQIKDKMELYLTVLGDGSLSMSDSELKYGNTGPMKKAIVARRPIKKGEKLTFSNLCFKRTEEESPVPQKMFINLLGIEAYQDIDKDEIIDFSKVKYRFNKQSYSDLTGGLED